MREGGIFFIVGTRRLPQTATAESTVSYAPGMKGQHVRLGKTSESVDKAEQTTLGGKGVHGPRLPLRQKVIRVATPANTAGPCLEDWSGPDASTGRWRGK